ncbi:MAG: phage portal protein [Verrucomicrobiota bacterium]
MPILKHILDRFRPAQKSSMPVARAFLRGDDEPESGSLPLVNPYQQSAWVYAAVCAKAAKIAQIPFRLSRAGVRRRGENLVTSGPLYDLFQRPHPRLDRFAFWELISTWLDLRGEVFLVALDADGRVQSLTARPRAFPVRSLLVLPPDDFQEIITDHQLTGWRYQPGGPYSPLPGAALLPEEVIHLKLPNPFQFWRGMSPLTVAQLAVQTDYASAQFMKGLMLNNADPGLIVTANSCLSEHQMEQIYAALRERKRRPGAADRPLFLPFDVKVDKPALRAADVQFLENRKFSRQEIGSIFKVPQTILGYTEDANRSVDEQQSLNWLINVILPLGRRIEAALQPLLDLAGPELSGWFDPDALPEMQAARRARVDTAVKLATLGVPFNDLNRELDLGFPEYAWGNEQRSQKPEVRS